MKTKKLTDAEKVRLYEAALNDIAGWDTQTLSHCDEPGAAALAREVLGKTNADKYVKQLVIKSSHRRVRIEA